MAAKVFIDACVFIEAALYQPRAEECRGLLKKIAAGQLAAITSDYCIYAFVLALLGRGLPHHKAREAFETAMRIPNIEIYRPELEAMRTAIVNAGKSGLGFDDALVLACMKKAGAVSMATLDSDFLGKGVAFEIAPRGAGRT